MQKGLIHFHDADYFAQHMHNCCLVNLEDMLQNGTVISETGIDRPRSFFHGLQYSNTGDCADCKFAVWRTEYFTVPSGTVRTGEP